MNLGVVGGGSGGHITPISSFLSYIEKYRKDESIIKSIVWFGESYSLEQKAATSYPRVCFQPIYAGKIRRYWNLSSTILNIRDLFLQCVGFFQSLFFLTKYNIDILFCKGGHVALALSCAAYVLQIPIIVHESDTVGGLTNRIVGKIAKKIFSGFEHKGSETIGQLLSLDLLDYQKSSLERQLETWYDPSKTTFLIMGGSQGSQVINESMLSLLDKGGLILECQILVIGGSKNAGYREKLEKYMNCRCFGFLSLVDMGYLYSISDVAIARSSATSVAEQKLFGLQCIYIPLPYAVWTYFNAIEYIKQYPGDMLLEQKEGTIPGLEAALLPYIGYKKSVHKIDRTSLLYPHSRLYETVLELFVQQKKR